MTTRQNKKRTPKKKSKRNPPSGLAAFKAFLLTLLIATLSAIGLWRCLDDGDTQMTGESKARKRAARAAAVDVGKGKTADPTLVNEKQLLREEIPEAPPEPVQSYISEETAEEEPQEEAPVFPNFGVAFHFHTQMRAEPDAGAPVVAYARRGATFRLSERVSTEGCSKGWYEVAPGGLFVCSGAGVLVGNEPVSFAPSPPPANLDKPLPYRYEYVTADNTPEFWRVPTAEEMKDVEALFTRMAEREASVKEADTGGTPPSSSTGAALSPAPTAALPPPSPAPATVPAKGETTAPPPAGAIPPLPDAGVGAEAAPLELPPFIHLRMARGYYVSADDEVEENGVRMMRTIRGRFVPEDRLATATPSDFEGLLLQGHDRLPRTFVVGGGMHLLRREKEGGPLLNHDRIERLSVLDFLGTIKHRNRIYVQVGDGLFLPSRVVAKITAVAPPDDIGENERWIDVDLSEQTLVAYEGARPVFATLVSTGRESFETPTGSFRIYSKHVTITMDDPEAGEEAYSIEDVPWVQYFNESFALHGAFWHNRFGRVRSHGCVNLSPKDARRLFFWTGPHLPEGVHGASATKDNPGTRVIIHE